MFFFFLIHIAHCYHAKEAIEFCIEFLVDLQSIGVPSIRNMTSNDGKTLGGGTVFEVEDLLWEQAHRYVLENTDDIQPNIE